MRGPGLLSLNLVCYCRRGFDSRDAQTGLTLAKTFPPPPLEKPFSAILLPLCSSSLLHPTNFSPVEQAYYVYSDYVDIFYVNKCHYFIFFKLGFHWILSQETGKYSHCDGQRCSPRTRTEKAITKLQVLKTKESK